MKQQRYKTRLTLLALLLAASAGMYAQNKPLSQARIYINPGHGGWGPNDRPMATINYQIYDTLGFFESKANLWKGLELHDQLTKAGAGYVRMSRTRNNIVQLSANVTEPNQYEVPESPGQLATLSVIARDVEENNMDYFLSIHSNATTDGSETNYPLLLYRGTDQQVGNGLTNARQMALDAWKYIANNGITYYSHYAAPTANNTRGDVSFMGSSSASELGYVGYFGVLKHGCDGFLSEGSFHTYHPDRQRLLNRDYCRQEGLRMARAIRKWFGDETETKGCIMGTVKDKNKSLEHSLYKYAFGSFDQYLPLNEVKVVLQDANGNPVAEYTTDKEHNGVYVFAGLPPGKYQLVYDIPGYWKETSEIKVVANETAYINKLLTDTSKPEPVDEEVPREVEYYTHPQQDGDIAGASTYNLTKDTDIPASTALDGLTVRRAIHRFGKYYVLAVDNAKAPRLLVLNPATGELIKEMSTTGVVTESDVAGKSFAYALSDIAFTNDSVLIGVNSTVVGKKNNAYQTGSFFMYKWQASEGTPLEDANPEVLLKLETNNDASIMHAGANNSNFMANSIAVNGTSKDFTFYFDSHAGSSWTTTFGVRYVAWKVKNGVITGSKYNNSPWKENVHGEDVRITLSPLGIDRLIVDGNSIKPKEFQMEWTKNEISNVVDFAGDITPESAGAAYFRYARQIYMSAPVCEKQADNTYTYRTRLFDITNGLNKAQMVGNTEAFITNQPAITHMTANGVVDNADIDLYLLVGNQSVKHTTKGVEQPTSPARIFAYGLSAQYSTADNGYKIGFSLNENATNVDLVLTNADTAEDVKTISLGAKNKGTHEIVLADTDIPENTRIHWAIRATAPNVTRMTKLSDDGNVYKYFAPKGVAIDKSPESNYFGRIYITNTADGETAGRTTTKGLYVLGADLSDVSGQGDNAHAGGIAWTGTNAESPRKVAVAADGRIFIADASTTNAGIFYMNPENFTAASLFPGATVDAGAVKIGDTYVAGQTVALGVIGSGADTKLYAVDKKKSGVSYKKMINVYHIGENNTWTTAPTSSAAASSYIGNDNSSIIPVATGYWAGQFRGAGSNTTGNPCMFYYSNKHDKAVFNTANFKDPQGNVVTIDKASQNGGLAVNETEGTLALSYNGGVYVFEFKYNKDGVPQVSPRFQHPLGVPSVTYDDFEFDFAGNLYAVSLSGKFVSTWAMPTTNNTCTTPAKRTSVITRGNVSLPGKVTELKAEVQGKDIVLTWNKPAELTDETGVAYKIYLDGVEVATVTEKAYTHTNRPEGIYQYAVAALVGSYETTQAQVTAQIITASVANVKSITSIYPNPTEGRLVVETTEDIRNIELFDISGKMVYSLHNLSGQKQEIDLSDLRAGIYLLRVNSGLPMRVVKK